MLRLDDPQKHKVLYTWELYDVIVNFQCVQDLLFLRIINSKQSGAVHMSRASPANRADSILSRPMVTQILQRTKIKRYGRLKQHESLPSR